MAQISGKIFDGKLFSKLMVYVKPFKITYYFVLAAAILLSLFSTLTPYLLKVTVDDFIRPKDYEGMLLFVGLMFGALFLEVLFQFLFVFYANWLGQRVIKNLRTDLFQKIILFKMSYFDKTAVMICRLLVVCPYPQRSDRNNHRHTHCRQPSVFPRARHPDAP